MDPEARNRTLLNLIFKFKRGAPLQKLLHTKTGSRKDFYSLAEILTILKDMIALERMFDERNPTVILCSKELEMALNQRAFHVTEVRDLVLDQLELLPGRSQQGNPPPKRGTPHRPNPQAVPRATDSATHLLTNKDTKFRLKPLFLDVVRMVDGVNPEQIVFTYEEITNILSKYILSKKNAIFDTRNIKLALVGTDPLGKAFGVTAFHRCQVNALLRTQLIPVHPDRLLDQVLTTTNPAPGLSVSSVSVASAAASSSSSPSLPSFPASLPASFSNRRRRTSSTEKSEEETSRGQKLQRGGSNTETIYSEQDYETIKAEEEDGEDSSRGSDSGTTQEVFEVEYDIDSEEGEERPPQAYGKTQDFSSAGNSDTSADENFHASTSIFPRLFESVYWADSEEGKEGEREVAEGPEHERVECTSCKLPSDQPLVTYCSSCWNTRKQWTPGKVRRRKTAAKGLGLTGLSKPVYLNSTSSGSTSRSSTMAKAEQDEVVSVPNLKQGSRATEMCMFCEVSPRNALFIHGKLGHQVCCYPCAKRHWRNFPNCPICKRRVEKIVKAI